MRLLHSKVLQSYQLHQSIYTKLFFCFHPSYLWVCERVVRWYSGECKSERKRHLNFFNYKFLCMITGAHIEVFNKSQGKHGWYLERAHGTQCTEIPCVHALYHPMPMNSSISSYTIFCNMSANHDGSKALRRFHPKEVFCTIISLEKKS